MVGQPGAALRAVVVGAGRTHLVGELLLPVHALGTVGDAEAILDADAGMRIDELPGQLVGADVQAAPALRIGNEAGYGHRPLEHHWQRLAFRDILPVTRRGAPDFFG